MRVRLDGLQFCPDCSCWAANHDDSGIDYHYDATQKDELAARRLAVHNGVAAFGEHLVYSDNRENPDDEQDEYQCCSCGVDCFGSWCFFATLENGDD